MRECFRAAACCSAVRRGRVADKIYLRQLRGPRESICEQQRASAGRGCGPRSPADCKYPRASAHPAAEAISGEGRPRRRSVKNRRPFDCFKSAEGIRFSVGARTNPKSFHRGGFGCYLLSVQKVTYEKNTSCHRTQVRIGIANERFFGRDSIHFSF